MNLKNFKKILDKIKKDPNSWDQSNWHCGTSHCFAGHCQIEMGQPINANLARRDGREFLEISNKEAFLLFSGEATIKEFENFLRDGGYDADGYDVDGYDVDGYDVEGLDKYNKPRK